MLRRAIARSIPRTSSSVIAGCIRALLSTVLLALFIGALVPRAFHRTRCPPGPPLHLSVNQSSSVPPTFDISPAPQHTFLPNGLLSINPNAPAHPIAGLTAHAQAEWNAKLTRASRTLEEAAREYERRYKRLPPKGFDIWWKWAVEEHGVRLPDEYDQITSDLAPYWGISPADLRILHERRAQKEYIAVLGKDTPHDRISVLQSTFPPSLSNRQKKKFLKGAEKDQISVLRDVEHLLPPFRILYWLHDNGDLFRDWEAWGRAVEAGKRRDGEYFDILNWENEPNRPWESACPPDSLARLYPTNFSDPLPSPFSPASQHENPPRSKTFIHTPSAVYSPCTHPSLLRLHGAYLASHPFPGAHRSLVKADSEAYADLLVPQISSSHVALKDDITTANAYDFVARHPGGRVKWKDKVQGWYRKGGERVLWRGRTTGLEFTHESRWRETQRPRLVELASGEIDPGHPLEISKANHTACVLSPPPPVFSSSDWSKGSDHTGSKHPMCTPIALSDLSSAYLDIAFTGNAVQCEGEPVHFWKSATGTCKELAREYAWADWVSDSEEGRYKFIFDVDGNGWSGRFKRLLTTGSVVLKATAYSEWFTDRIQPWVHYVPVQMDYSDLFDILAYFRGEVPSPLTIPASSSSGSPSTSSDEAILNTSGSSDARKRRAKRQKDEADARARSIGEAGHAWSEVFWRREDLTAYQFRLILEYIRIMSPERDSNPEAVSYRYPGSG